MAELWLGGGDDVSSYLALPENVHEAKSVILAKFMTEFRGAAGPRRADRRARDRPQEVAVPASAPPRAAPPVVIGVGIGDTQAAPVLSDLKSYLNDRRGDCPQACVVVTGVCADQLVGLIDGDPEPLGGDPLGLLDGDP